MIYVVLKLVCSYCQSAKKMLKGVNQQINLLFEGRFTQYDWILSSASVSIAVYS